MTFRDSEAEEKLFQRRVLVAFDLVVICFDILIYNLYNLQICQHRYYTTRSNTDDIKMLPVTPTRGMIYDRNGIPLVRNVTWYDIFVTPYETNDMNALLQQLTPIVDLTPDDIDQFRHELKTSSRYRPVVLKNALTDVEIVRFSVNQFHFSDVNINSYKDRQYPYGAALAHISGYVSKINDSDLKILDQKGLTGNYAVDHSIGKQGIERHYGNELHGKTDYQEVEVDNHGRIVRLIKDAPPVAGKDIHLTLDLHLQQYIESLLAGQRAAALVEDPHDGSVLAMVSNPSHDPNPFIKGISYQDYNKLLQGKDLPLINRVTQGLYPPASTVKPYITMSALLNGVITPQTSFFGVPTWTLPGTKRYYRDWRKTGHGMLDATKAIEESAGTFFYQVAYMMGIDRINSMFSQFGYGKPTGIDLDEERNGLLPNHEWKQKVHKKAWHQGDTISVGIGQGYWIAAPIQTVKAMVTLTNNGKVVVPHLLLDEESGKTITPYQAPEAPSQIASASSPYWGLVRQAMFSTANEPNGTGYKFFHTVPYGIVAKSNTSQVFNLRENRTYNAKVVPIRLHSHVFYTVFAPYKNPKVAVALVLESGGSDGVTTAPVMRQIMDHLFAPQDNTVQTVTTEQSGPIAVSPLNTDIKSTFASIR